MRVPRVYTESTLAPGALVQLEQESSHHVAQVLRLRVGDAVCLFNGKGVECEGRIISLSKQCAGVTLDSYAEVTRESPLRITLAQGISRGERMDYTIQKAVELGVNAIVPVISHRTTVKLDEDRADKRMEHWRRGIISACEQCGRNCLPTLLPVQRLDQWLTNPTGGLKLLLRGNAETSLPTAQCNKDIVVLIGPEGGLTEPEVNAAERAGYLPMRLGPRILRTETA